jgi:hypothetical protein
MSYMSKFVAALVGLLLMALVISWELFLFAVKDPSGVSPWAGTRSHLWLALGAIITACIAGSLMFRFFGLHEKMKWSKVKSIPPEPLLTALGGNIFINAPALVRFDAERWPLANSWPSEGQPNDRIPR